MDQIDHVYCCICAPSCRVWLCWRCRRGWLAGACARAFWRELVSEASLIEDYSTSPERPPPR